MYKIVIKWQHDEDSSYINDDTCHKFEPNVSRDNYAHQLDITGTFTSIVNDGGQTDEQEAWRQTSYAWNRLRQWHNDQWNYVGCIATVYELSEDGNPEDDQDWFEVSDSSLWGINSDCGNYKTEVEVEQITEALSQLRSRGEITGFTHSGIPGDEWRIDGEHVELTEEDDSAYMTEVWDMDDSDMLPPMPVHPFELRCYGDTQLKYHCTECGTAWDTDDASLSDEDTQYGKCPQCKDNYVQNKSSDEWWAKEREILESMDMASIMAIPGVYEAIHEHLNNDVFAAFEKEYDDEQNR